MDMVIFEVRGQLFAYPATDVLEVRDVMPVTPLPFAPAHVDGLINVAGKVVTQMDAAQRLNLGERLAAAQGSVLLLQNASEISAVHVDRVLNKVAVAPEAVAWCVTQGEAGSAHPGAASGSVSVLNVPDEHQGEPESQADSWGAAGITAGVEFIRGEFEWQGRAVLLLHGAVFSLDGIHAVHVPAGRHGMLGASASLATQLSSAEQDASGNMLCMMLQCGKERYAIEVRYVQEIVESELLTSLPHAPDEIAGMATLRGTPLLVLSLGKLLGAVTAGAELTAGSALVVVECRSLRFALLTDKVIDIQSIAQDAVQSAEQGEEFDGYLIGQSGTLVGLLNLERLITEQRMHSYRQYLVRNPALGRQDKSHSVSGVKRRFLSFMIGREYCGIPLESVQRVEESSVLTELPRTGYKVLNDDEAGRGLSENSLSGVVQIQGKIVPVIDLRCEFGLSAASGHTGQQGSTSQQARVASLNSVFLVVSVDDNSYAMRVDAVERVVSIAQEAIEPVQHASSDFIESVGRLDGRLISLLSLEPLKQGAT